MAAKKILYILRHAKAASGKDDHARPLAERGLKESQALGEYVKARHIKPEKILCSTSLRTRQTFEQAKLSSPSIEYTEKLYLASAEAMLKIIAAIPDSVASLMLIGHNPGLHELCLKLVKSGEGELVKKMVGNFPPASLAIFSGEESWRDMAEKGAALIDFVMPG